MARAILRILEADSDVVAGQLFNIGSDEQNYRIGELARLIADSLSSKPTIEWYGDPDKRSYKVSFEKARRLLGFNVETTPEKASREIEAALLSSKIDDDPRTITLNWYKHIMSDPGSSGEVIQRGVVL